MRTRIFFGLSIAMLLVMAAGVGPARAAVTITVPDDYATIQAAIDAASAGDTIAVKPGLYVEDLSIISVAGSKDGLVLKGDGCSKSIIQGVSQGGGSGFPLAFPNIDLQANNVLITRFTIQSPLVTDGPLPDPSGFYSSGMVVVGTDNEISHNCFEAGTGAGSQAIQTWAGNNASSGLNDISGLYIHDNKFTNRSPATVASDANGYEGIYINPQGAPIDPSNPVVINKNKFSGQMYRAIDVDCRSWVQVSENELSTDWPGTAPLAASLFPRGIQLVTNLNANCAGPTSGNDTVSKNKVKKGLGTFYVGIWVRNTTGNTDVVNSAIDSNEVDKAVFGIAVEGSGGDNLLRKNSVKNSSAVGIYVDDDTTIVENTMEKNLFGLFVNSDNVVVKNKMNHNGTDLTVGGTGNTFLSNKCSGVACP